MNIQNQIKNKGLHPLLSQYRESLSFTNRTLILFIQISRHFPSVIPSCSFQFQQHFNQAEFQDNYTYIIFAICIRVAFELQ